MRPAFLAGGLSLLLAAGLPAQDSVTVAAGPQYAAGGLRRVLFGSDWRQLWTTPMRVPVLDLASVGGGLAPVRTGGGRQTTSLRLRGADGREYVFRSVDKDPSAVLPEELRRSLAAGVVRDQTSAAHPMAALIVAPILAAAGVPHARPQLAVMPDDPHLGEFRAEFAGMLGFLEERPDEPDDGTPGLAGAVAFASTERLLELLEERPNTEVDAALFLRARLLDLFLGDWDRHADQWRWGRLPADRGGHWVPIPRDRDQAFSRYDGLVLGMARQAQPELLVFGDRYPAVRSATWVGRDLDRRLLTGLAWDDWQVVAGDLAARLTDSVLADAVRAQPPELAALSAGRIEAALRARRDGLPAYARQFYELLAREVDITATDTAEVLEVHRLAADSVRVVLRLAGTRDVRYERHFLGAETGEVRVHLRGGRDSAMVEAGAGPLVRVVGGGGRDLLRATGGRQVRFYDHGGATDVDGAPFDERDWAPPPKHRDWGSSFPSRVLLGAGAEVGLLVMASGAWERHGFRQAPYAWALDAEGAWSFSRGAGRLQLTWINPPLGGGPVPWVRAVASGIEVLRFHGFGNGTRDTLDAEAYRVLAHAYELRPGLRLGDRRRWGVEVSVPVRHVRTDLQSSANAGTVLEEVAPVGSGDAGRVGLAVRLEHDGRDAPLVPRRGSHLRVDGAGYPVTWSGDHGAFARVEVAGEVNLPLAPALTLAARAFGAAVGGTYPWDEAAYLGGRGTLAGYRPNRFAGDQAVAGGVELRWDLLRVETFLPGQLGLFLLGEAGRVFGAGDTSPTWHRDVGAGAYYAILGRAASLAAGVAASREGPLAYFALGLGN